MSEPRQTLRTLYRQTRNSLSIQTQQSAAKNCLSVCQNANVFDSVTTLACYLANDGELDPIDIIRHGWQQSIQIVLPVLHPEKQGQLSFMPYSKSTVMQVNQYGILEPKYQANKQVDICDIDVVFTPLVAFDKQGNRLGMGGGYYDRTFEGIQTKQHAPRLIGLAHDCQQAAAIPTDNWDIPLSAIATDSRWIPTSIR